MSVITAGSVSMLVERTCESGSTFRPPVTSRQAYCEPTGKSKALNACQHRRLTFV
jgi:hypothetical protein